MALTSLSSFVMAQAVKTDRPVGKAQPKIEIPAGLPIDRTPPPDDPKDEGPSAETVTTDQALQFFQARVDRDPGDAGSYVYLGEFQARKTREVGDLSGYELRRGLNPTRPEDSSELPQRPGGLGRGSLRPTQVRRRAGTRSASLQKTAPESRLPGDDRRRLGRTRPL